MPLVVDASALIDYILRTGGYPTFGPVIVDADELHIPALCDVEVASSLRSALLSRALEEWEARDAFGDFASMPFTRHGHLDLIPRVLELRDNFSAYDAVYIALAEHLGAGLLTGDVRLARAIRRHLPLRVLPHL